MQRLASLISVGFVWVLLAAPGSLLARGGFPDLTFDYCFEADPEDNQLAGAQILDGTWVHDNGSDAFDGSTPQDGDGAPGGAEIIDLAGEGDGGGDASVLYMEDTGDPRNAGFADPSNRKMFFQKDTSGMLDLSEGVTMVLRMRLNEEPIDATILPEQAGYNLHDNGKGIGFVQRTAVGGTQTGNLSLHISNEGNLEFAQDFGNDGICDEFAADDPLSNCFALDDPFDWNTFWIAAQEFTDPIPGIRAAIFVNGDTEAIYDDIVLAPPTGFDGPSGWTSYIAMELGSTPQNGSIFIDYFCVASGFHEPESVDPNCPGALVTSTSGRDVVLGWTNGAVPPTNVDVSRNGEEIADDAPADPPTFTDPNPSPGLLEYVLEFDNGAACAPLTATVDTCPSGLTATVSASGVQLSWTNGLEYDAIIVTRDDVVIGDLLGDATEFLDTSPNAGINDYRVVPSNGTCAPLETSVQFLVAPPADGDFSGEGLDFDYVLDPEVGADPADFLQHNPIDSEQGDLDGLWTSGNGSDEWDGSAPGEVGDPLIDPASDSPGGIGLIDDGDVGAYIYEDTGNPTNSGWNDPSNRKLYTCLDAATVSGLDPITEATNHLFEGITIRARFRLSPDAIDLVAPNLPPNGTQPGFGGKGMFTFYQDIGLTLIPDGASQRLGFALDVDPANPDVGELIIGEANPIRVVVEEPTAWQDVWVTAEDADGDGLTPELALEVYFNGSTDPTVSIEDYLPDEGGMEGGAAVNPSGNALCMGIPSTADSASFQVDLVAIALEAIAPEGGTVQPGPVFRRGDTDGNGKLEVTDPINSLSFQFLGTFTPPCRDAADFDDNGKIEITDPIANLSHQFLGQAPPAAPGKDDCGVDPSPDDGDGDGTPGEPGDDLGCLEYPAAGAGPEAACD